jgi:hypothetical protein
MTFALREGVTLAELETGTVLLDEHTGKFWQLNRSGAVVLRRMLDGERPHEIASALAEGSDADAARAARDVGALIDHLREAKLVST